MRKQVEQLRELMKSEKVDIYLVNSADAHNSEYVSEHDKEREWLTGFTGSNGTAVITASEALLWTDGRYYIQCEKELQNTGITMMKMGESDCIRISDYIAGIVNASDKTITLGFAGSNVTRADIDIVSKKIKNGRLRISTKDLIAEIWQDRPEAVHAPVWIHDEQFCEVSVADKISAIRDVMKNSNCSHLLISTPADIMWLYNVRGGDVEYNPVALSYGFVTDDDAFVFLDGRSISPQVRSYFISNRIILCEYDDFYDFLKEYPYSGKMMLDDKQTSYLAYSIIEKNVGTDNIVVHTNPTEDMKAVKNETEIKMMKEYFIKDSAAMTKYLYYLKTSAPESLNEYECARKCDELRKEIAGFICPSFATIAAYGENAAMMHYEATKDSYAEVREGNMLLTDCGGQYPGATTDVTRTVIIGKATDKMKRHYTLVLKGMLNLMNAIFIEGCTGRNVDILAREPLWEEFVDYKCGTGHGVGYCLGVHEGPQSVRWRYTDGHEATLRPGMTITDEPGVYIEGEYGIRTENTLLVVEKGKSADGTFLGFEPLTYVPLDPELIDASLLDKRDIKQLNEYNGMVYDTIAPLLTEEEAEWLAKNCNKLL